MNKDAYYFPHFCNARHDRKLLRLRKELGVEGYGIYFMLLEVLREQQDFKFPLDDIDLLADEFGVSETKVSVVVANYKLFDLDEDKMFFSLKLIEFLEPYLNMKEQRRIAGIASGKARRLKAENKQMLNECSTDVQRELNENEQSKEEESKLNNKYIVDVINYLNEKTGKTFKHSTAKTKDVIKARMNEGFTFDDFKKVIDIKVSEWSNNDMAKYLRPETLFSNKFEGYLNQEIKTKTGDDNPYRRV